MRLSHLPFLIPRWFCLYIVRGMGEFRVFPLHSPALGEIPAWLCWSDGWLCARLSAAASIIIDGWIFNHNSEHQSLSGWNARGVRYIYANCSLCKFLEMTEIAGIRRIPCASTPLELRIWFNFCCMCLARYWIYQEAPNVWSLFLAHVLVYYLI